MIICSTWETCKLTLLEVGNDAVTGLVACGCRGNWSCTLQWIRQTPNLCERKEGYSMQCAIVSTCLHWILDFCLTIVIEKLILTQRIFAKQDSWDEHFSTGGRTRFHSIVDVYFTVIVMEEPSLIAGIFGKQAVWDGLLQLVYLGDATCWLFTKVEASPRMPCCSQAIGIVPERINVLLEGVSLSTWIVLYGTNL